MLKEEGEIEISTGDNIFLWAHQKSYLRGAIGGIRNGKGGKDGASTEDNKRREGV